MIKLLKEDLNMLEYLLSIKKSSMSPKTLYATQHIY